MVKVITLGVGFCHGVDNDWASLLIVRAPKQWQFSMRVNFEMSRETVPFVHTVTCQKKLPILKLGFLTLEVQTGAMNL